MNPNEATKYGNMLLRALDGLGFTYKNESGHVAGIAFKTCACSDHFALFDVDLQRLPRRVKVPDLLEADVLHHLSAVCGESVRAVNHKGLCYVVGELPRPAPVRLPSRVLLDMGGKPEGELLVPLGIGAGGPVWRSVHELGHMLIAGVTGSGKSVWLNTAITALCHANGPGALRLALVDPKRCEFAQWAGLPHLWRPIAQDEPGAGALVDELLAEAENRAELLAGAGYRNVGAYNAHNEPLPVLVLVIDEALALGLQAGGESGPLMRGLSRLTMQGRALGIFVWLAAQHARADVLPRFVLVNVGTRLAFRLADAAQARLVGCAGAQDIKTAGRFIMTNGTDKAPLQGYYLDDRALAAIAARLCGGSGRQALSADERRLLALAQDQDGVFNVKRLYAATGPISAGGMSFRAIKAIAQGLERRGLLSSDPGDPTAARVLTDKARAMIAGDVRTGENTQDPRERETRIDA